MTDHAAPAGATRREVVARMVLGREDIAMGKKISRQPRRVATSAVVVMLVIRFALGAPVSTSSSSGVDDRAHPQPQGTIVYEWGFSRIVFP
jgi:hypothetical protein